jgi:hypothetical protein
MDNVALPAPAFASTTSVPAFWIRLVKLSNSCWENETGGDTWDNKGIIVFPEWPPITGTKTRVGSRPYNNNRSIFELQKEKFVQQTLASATNVAARTTSNVVTPIIFFSS